MKKLFGRFKQDTPSSNSNSSLWRSPFRRRKNNLDSNGSLSEQSESRAPTHRTFRLSKEDTNELQTSLFTPAAENNIIEEETKEPHPRLVITASEPSEATMKRSSQLSSSACALPASWDEAERSQLRKYSSPPTFLSSSTTVPAFSLRPQLPRECDYFSEADELEEMRGKEGVGNFRRTVSTSALKPKKSIFWKRV